MTADASVWRSLACAACDTCRRALAWLEGPLCDECLDAQEKLPPGTDVHEHYQAYRAADAAEGRATKASPTPRKTWRDTFALNLETGDLVFCRATFRRNRQ